MRSTARRGGFRSDVQLPRAMLDRLLRLSIENLGRLSILVKLGERPEWDIWTGRYDSSDRTGQRGEIAPRNGCHRGETAKTPSAVEYCARGLVSFATELLVQQAVKFCTGRRGPIKRVQNPLLLHRADAVNHRELLGGLRDEWCITRGVCIC